MNLRLCTIFPKHKIRTTLLIYDQSYYHATIRKECCDLCKDVKLYQWQLRINKVSKPSLLFHTKTESFNRAYKQHMIQIYRHSGM
jgi:hypothetical protein